MIVTMKMSALVNERFIIPNLGPVQNAEQQGRSRTIQVRRERGTRVARGSSLRSGRSALRI